MMEERRKTSQQDSSRLDRIESKLDRLSEAIISIARAEEKLVTLEQTRQETIERLNHHDDRMTALEANLNQAKGIGRLLLPMWASLAAAFIGFITYYHK